MSRTCLPIAFQVDGRHVGGETLVAEAGASVLVLTSCSAELGFELRSAYLEGDRGGETLVAEVAVIGGAPAVMNSRRFEGAEEAFTYQRRHLLYDHLQAVQDLLARGGQRLAFDGVEAAAAALDPDSPFVSAA